MGADNQQERPDVELCHYIAGFVDGEGSFHVAVQRNATTRLGIQVIPEFHVSQNCERASVLYLIRATLGCGYIKANHPGSTHDRSLVYVVRNRTQLIEHIIPFFERCTLRSSKQREFQVFASIVHALQRGEHLTKGGMIDILQRAFTMNTGKYRTRLLQEWLDILESSETVRLASSKNVEGKDTVRPAWRHAEASAEVMG